MNNIGICSQGTATFQNRADEPRLSVGSDAEELRLKSEAGFFREFTLSLEIGDMPNAAEPWSLTSLREKLIKIGAKVVSHGRYVTFQMAEVAVSRWMFTDILSLIARLRAPPAPA